MRSRRGDLRGAVVSRREAVDARRVHLMMKWAVSFWILSAFGRDAVRTASKSTKKRPPASCEQQDAARAQLGHLLNIRVVPGVEGLARERRRLVDAVPARYFKPFFIQFDVVVPRTVGYQ